MGEARQSRLDRTARWGRWLPLALILIGVLVRGWALGAVPGGLNQDEAFAGYEAWSLLTSGVDSWGYPYPCYLVAWGSGMNALESYLAMPFLQILCRNMNVRTERAFMAITSGAVLFTWLLRFMGAQPYYDLPIIGDKVYVWYMFAGYYLMKYRRKFRIRQRTLVLVCVLSMAVTFGVTWGATSAMDRHCDTQLAYSTPFAILAACAFFLFVIRLGNGRLQFAERTRKIIDVFCSCSFGIYLIHPIYLDNYKKHLAAADVPAWIIVPFLTVTLAVVSFLSVWLIRRVKIGRKIT